jgi:hypothetical protein
VKICGGLKIGFDVAQTCHDRAGCGWVADLLVRQMVREAPYHEFFLYHHFGTWINHDISDGTHLKSENVKEPLRALSGDRPQSIRAL